MEELVKTFHIDWKLMIAQVVNFAIVLGVLWKFALKPLQKVMSERSDEIDQSLKQAKEIEQKLAEADKNKTETIIQAKKESQNIIAKAKQEAGEIKEKKMSELKEELATVVESTKASLKSEKEQMIKQAKQEVAGLIIEVSGKIIGKNMDSEANKKMINESISKK